MNLQAAPENNPAGDAPSLEDEVFDVLSIDGLPGASGVSDDEPAPAATGGEPTPKAGEGVAAPSPSPEPTPSAAAEEPPTPAAAEPASEPPAGQPAPQAEPGTPQPAPQPPQPDEAALREASLTAQVDALKRTIETLRASPQPSAQPSGTPTGAAPESGQSPAEQLVRYNLTLPQPVMDQLQSEDPAQFAQAISRIVNDLGTIVHNSVINQVRQEVGAKFEHLSKFASESQETDVREAARADAKKQYYDAFPTHQNELIEPIIQTEARKMAAEFPGLPWNADYINALGARVNGALAQLRGEQPQPAPEPAPSGQQPPKKPAAMMPSGNRGGTGAPQPSSADEDLILDTLDPFAGG